MKVLPSSIQSWTKRNLFFKRYLSSEIFEKWGVIKEPNNIGNMENINENLPSAPKLATELLLPRKDINQIAICPEKQ